MKRFFFALSIVVLGSFSAVSRKAASGRFHSTISAG